MQVQSVLEVDVTGTYSAGRTPQMTREEFINMGEHQRRDQVAVELSRALGYPSKAVTFTLVRDDYFLKQFVSYPEGNSKSSDRSDQAQLRLYVTHALRQLAICTEHGKPHPAMKGDLVESNNFWTYTPSLVLKMQKKRKERIQELLKIAGLPPTLARSDGTVSLTVEQMAYLVENM